MKIASASWRIRTRSRRDLARDPHGEAGPRERVAVEHLPRDPELLAEPPHLVLEELAERLDELEAELLRQAADVVVRLDDGGRAVDRDGLDDVRIERPLGEPRRPVDGLRVLGEDVDEEAADDLPLLLRDR